MAMKMLTLFSVLTPNVAVIPLAGAAVVTFSTRP
jgi:hypothetical protein